MESMHAHVHSCLCAYDSPSPLFYQLFKLFTQRMLPCGHMDPATVQLPGIPSLSLMPAMP